MKWLLSGLRKGGEARALRFLLLSLCGWVALRMIATWDLANPDVIAAVRPPPAPPALFVIAAAAPAFSQGVAATLAARASPMSEPRRRDLPRSGQGAASRPARLRARRGDRGFEPDRHDLRLVMMARFFPQPATAAAALPTRQDSDWSSMPPAAPSAGGSSGSFWMQRQLAGWSLGSWVYLRQGSGRASGMIGAGSQLGGSQAGLRLAYGLGETGPLRGYGRATVAIDQPKQRELAIGVAFAPVPRIPLDIAVEQRVALGREGRTALAAMIAGGVGDVALPAGFRLEAYAQAGVVGARRHDGFADGAVVVDRRMGADDSARIRIGALVAGAVQRGAARVDIGPRLTWKLPEVGKGSRIALDWRQRIAGDAQPESGVALTLATDF